ncbi:MAG: metallophosphoesterase [Clostridia bacterium]|nr:metallophosphoesterase [Clostridia bacterium]
MFWYIFTICCCVLIIVLIFVLRRMRRNAGELQIVREVFAAPGNGTGIDAAATGADAAGIDAAEAGNTRFCFISDVHIAAMPVPWSHILEAVRQMDPAFILITGDLANEPKELESAKHFIFCLSSGAGVPVLITPGNHDNIVAAQLPGGKAEFVDTFTSLPGDVRVLDDNYTVVADTLIGGLSDLRSRVTPAGELIEEWSRIAAERGLKFILASHNADILLSGDNAVDRAARDVNAPLPLPAYAPYGVFCGHTHGGQIRLVAGLEFKVLKDDKLPKQGIFYGRHDVGGYPLLLTSGLGCALLRLRSGTRPEVGEIILKNQF